jgi:hypothetical protein
VLDQGPTVCGFKSQPVFVPSHQLDSDSRSCSNSGSNGIFRRETVYEHVGNKLVLGYEYLGEQTDKNIRQPRHPG